MTHGQNVLNLKPLSAITESPLSNDCYSSPLHRIISPSDILLVYSWLTNVIAPLGEMLTSPFNVT